MGVKVDDNVMVIDVEFDGLHPVVSVDAPESFRHRLSYSRAVKLGNKVSFQLLLRIYDDGEDGDGENCGGCNVGCDEVKEEYHEISGDDDEDDCVKGHACRPTKPPDKRYDEEASPGNGPGSRKDERGDDSFDCKDFEKGSYGKLEEEEEECEKPRPPKCESGFDDMKVPTNDNPRSSNSGPGDNPEKKPDEDCFEGNKTLGEDENYVPEECQTPEYCNGTTFQQEEKRTNDHQFDCRGSFSFDEEQYAEFVSDFRPPQSSNPSHPATTKYASHVVQDSIVDEREKMKKTDEYKRAVEAEWAARQQEIQNQAEEAQRLRKKRKLEISEAIKKAQEAERQLKRKKEAELRASEIKTRQEQRVKEMREAKKKDELDGKAKERYRAEIKRKISLLQVQCRDLPSLLRNLGFRINGGATPSPEELPRPKCIGFLLISV
ncbi:unnamed protein product [Linum tenue]|uniref:Uncharacterized protein n=1 Tax=Linum tenue TaxID=586396 RepID=A0AAV0HYX0_9ROSI|nr:unnamed protein product [Linum tenue]